jgi:hypothetical protein
MFIVCLFHKKIITYSFQKTQEKKAEVEDVVPTGKLVDRASPQALNQAKGTTLKD